MHQNKNSLTALIIGAIGIVYGDIGTSPLYALKSCFMLTSIAVNEANILGILSIFIWLLILIVNIKYISIILRCEQQGEGGVLILSSLCSKLNIYKLKKFALVLGIIGVSLFVGDSVITPAISVLSALEGIKLVANISETHIVIGSIFILSILFWIQSKGSGHIGNYFGPVMIIWFVILGVLGLISIINNPEILLALNPYYAIKFLTQNGSIGWIALGGAILVITGVEALYADMGHFGKVAIKRSWMLFVLPSLMLNYLGQGALLLTNPKAIDNPFYLLASENFVYPLVILSIMATIIASQAVISGLFSLVWQAIMLHYLPRLNVKHTSFNHKGQIYVPTVNYILFALTVVAVISFRTSDSLAFTYGLSVASVMLISTILVSFIAFYQWKWSIIKMVLIFVPLFCLDSIFVSTSLMKILEGAWYSLLIAGGITYVIMVWIRGNEALKHQKTYNRQNLYDYLQEYLPKYQSRIPGCAIFMSRNVGKVPYALEVQLQHNKYLHKKIIFIAIATEEEPRVAMAEKFSYEEILPNIFSLKVKFGFYEIPDLNKIIVWAEEENILGIGEDISFFLSRGLPIASKHSYLGKYSEKLYIFLAKNALPAYEFFKINHHKVVELGVRYKV